jgi:hypothetical protein
MIKETEQAIVDRILEKVEGCRVDPFPLDLEKYLERNPVRGTTILVGYIGSRYSQADQDGCQDAELGFELMIIKNSVLAHSDGYPVVETIITDLSEFHPNGSAFPLSITSDSFVVIIKGAKRHERPENRKLRSTRSSRRRWNHKHERRSDEIRVEDHQRDYLHRPVLRSCYDALEPGKADECFPPGDPRFRRHHSDRFEQRSIDQRLPV